MKLSFRLLTLPNEQEILVDFLSSQSWPFHSSSTINHDEIIEKISEGAFSGEGLETFWIVTETQQPVGFIKLFDLDDIDDGGSPLFDLRVLESMRDQSIGKQAVQWLTQYLFEKYPTLRRIEGTTRVDNIAMRKVFLSCGYAKEGHIRKSWPAKDGNVYDTVIYGILREDWLTKTLTPVPWND